MRRIGTFQKRKRKRTVSGEGVDLPNYIILGQNCTKLHLSLYPSLQQWLGLESARFFCMKSCVNSCVTIFVHSAALGITY